MNRLETCSASGESVQVKWLTKALRKLNDEAEFIAQDNLDAAQAVVQRIHDAVDNLKVNPGLGRPGRIQGTRELVVAGTPYIIPYRVRPRLKRVEVLRVSHASRRLPESW